jgi:pilus assembly protein Flp/PilA
MTRLRAAIRLLLAPLADRRAATAVEYGLICALIVIAIIASIRGVATSTTAMWNTVSNNVTAAS